MVSLYHYKNSRASLAVMEDLEDLEEIGVYLEAASCLSCHQLTSSNSILEEKLRYLQSSNYAREQRLKVLNNFNIFTISRNNNILYIIVVVICYFKLKLQFSRKKNNLMLGPILNTTISKIIYFIFLFSYVILQFMEENALAWEEKASEYEMQADELKKERLQLQESLEELDAKNSKLLKELESMRLSIEQKPEMAPPPPAPPMPKFRLHFWKPTNGVVTKKSRSKSLNRVEDFKKKRNPNAPMVLNSDILDAIKNRRYSLRHVDDADERRKSLVKNQYHSDANLAQIIKRQSKMVYSDEEDDDEKPIKHNYYYSSNNYSASLPRLPTIMSMDQEEEEEEEDDDEETDEDETEDDEEDGPKSVIYIGGGGDEVTIINNEITKSSTTIKHESNDDNKTTNKKFNSF